MLDIGPRTAIKNAETIRQSIEKIVFHATGQNQAEELIRLTVGGGITEVAPRDTLEGLLERLEKTLQQAKKTGPNQSFSHDGKQSELVESPSFGIEEIEITI